MQFASSLLFEVSNIKYNQVEFEKKVFDLVGDEYTLLSGFTGMKQKVHIKHNVCDYIFSPVPYEFLVNGTRCPKCAIKKLSIGEEEFRNRVKTVSNDEYEVLGPYVNNRTNILMRHKTCDQKFMPKPSSFLFGSRCPYCAGRKSNITSFKRELFNEARDEYVLVGSYLNKNTQVDLLHMTCGEIYHVKPVNFLKNGYRCPKCKHHENGIKRRKSNEKFINELVEKLDGEYIALEEYQTAHKKITFKHLTCGEKFLAKPNALISRNASCPKCSRSGPESLIEWYLLRNNITFSRECRFDDCLGKRRTKLPFDFAIYDKNNQLFCLLEYDGQQHFMPSFGVENYERTVLNDGIKNKYCEEKEIELIRIPYWELNNIYSLLDEKLLPIL